MILSYSNFLQTPGLEKKRYLLAMMAMILVGFFWAVVETLGHYIPRGYSPIQTVWSRYLVHMLFMLAAFGPRKRTSLIRTDCLWMQISRALLMLGMPVCFIAGAAFLPIDVVWVVSWCAVTIELGLSAWILRERVRPGLWIAAASGWLGVWVMSGVDFPPLELAIPGTCRHGILFCSICRHDPVHVRGKHIDQTVPYRPVGVRGIEPDRAVFMENSHAAPAGYLHFNRHHWLLLPFFSGQSHRDGAGVNDRTDYLYGSDMVLPSRLYH